MKNSIKKKLIIGATYIGVGTISYVAGDLLNRIMIRDCSGAKTTGSKVIRGIEWGIANVGAIILAYKFGETTYIKVYNKYIKSLEDKDSIDSDDTQSDDDIFGNTPNLDILNLRFYKGMTLPE